MDVFNAYDNLTLPDLGIDPESFNYYTTNIDVMRILSAWSTSHWMDLTLDNEFYLKGYKWDHGHGETYYSITKMIASNAWKKTKKALKKKSNTYVMDPNTQKCMDKVFARWSWGAFQRKLKDP